MGARGCLGVDFGLGTSWLGSVRGGGTVCGGAIGRTAKGALRSDEHHGRGGPAFSASGWTGSSGTVRDVGLGRTVCAGEQASRSAARRRRIDGAKIREGRGVSHYVARVGGPVERRSRRRRRLATHRFFEAPGRSRSERRVRWDVARLLAPKLEARTPHTVCSYLYRTDCSGSSRRRRVAGSPGHLPTARSPSRPHSVPST